MYVSVSVIIGSVHWAQGQFTLDEIHCHTREITYQKVHLFICFCVSVCVYLCICVAVSVYECVSVCLCVSMCIIFSSEGPVSPHVPPVP